MEITKNSPRQQSCHTDSCTLFNPKILSVLSVPLWQIHCPKLHRYAKKPIVSPLFATLTHSLSRKSFPCHSYANTRDRSVTSPPIPNSVSLCLGGKPSLFNS